MKLRSNTPPQTRAPSTITESPPPPRTPPSTATVMAEAEAEVEAGRNSSCPSPSRAEPRCAPSPPACASTRSARDSPSIFTPEQRAFWSDPKTTEALQRLRAKLEEETLTIHVINVQVSVADRTKTMPMAQAVWLMQRNPNEKAIHKLLGFEFDFRTEFIRFKPSLSDRL